MIPSTYIEDFMAKTYLDIQAQIARLQAEAEALRAKEVADVVGRIREAMAHYGLKIADLGIAGKRGRRPASAVNKKGRTAAAPKYSDGQGNVWGGRGPRPAWLRNALAQGHALEEFATQVRADLSTALPAKAPKARKTSVPAKRVRQSAKPSARSAKAGVRSRKRSSASSPVQAESAVGGTSGKGE
jgi:DNA-binding protein H-NS